MSKITNSKKTKAANAPSLETIFEGISLDDGANDIASLLSRKYVQLGVKDYELRHKDGYVKEKTSICIENNKNLKEDLIVVREAHAKAADKRDRLISLCADLVKRCTVSTRPILEEASAKRKLITDSFEGDIKKVTSRVDELSERKLAINKYNDILKNELTVVIEEMQRLDKEDEKVAKGEGGLIEDEVPRLVELDMMSYEDYMMNANDIMDRQDSLRSKIAAYTELFAELQGSLKATTADFEVHRKRIDELATATKEQHKEKFETEAKTKSVSKEIKRLSTLSEELTKLLDEEKEKKEKLQKIVAAFEQDVRAKEAELAKFKASM
jgi:hypothetical protein